MVNEITAFEARLQSEMVGKIDNQSNKKEVDLDTILDEARVLDCSDLHFTIKLPPIIRLHGSLKKLSDYPEMTEESIDKIVRQMISGEKLKDYENFADVDLSYVTPKGFRHRINIYHQKGAPAIAMRLLKNEVPTMEELKLPQIMENFADHPRGLILVTGPTGVGKSTTLAAMIDHINSSRASHIITVEDPLEYVHEHKKCMINQREIGDDVESFALSLRAALREDPDVILVGEMRDLETTAATITAAETGHLVLSTLHTTCAADTINRIIDVFPAHQQRQVRTQLSTILVGIVAQTLIPKADGTGRILAAEILNATDAIKAMIRDDKVHLIQSAIQTGKKEGMVCLDQELARLVRRGIIEDAAAREKAISIDEYERFLTGVPVGQSK